MKFFAATLLGISLLLVPAVSFAQSGGTGYSNTTGGTGYSNTSKSQSVQNPLGVSSFCGLIKAILQAVIAIGIPIAVLFIVYAGFKFVIAQGKPDKLKEARANLLYVFVGIGIFLGAWLLAMVIANTINAVGQGSGQTQIISCQ